MSQYRGPKMACLVLDGLVEGMLGVKRHRAHGHRPWIMEERTESMLKLETRMQSIVGKVSQRIQQTVTPPHTETEKERIYNKRENTHTGGRGQRKRSGVLGASMYSPRSLGARNTAHLHDEYKCKERGSVWWTKGALHVGG